MVHPYSRISQALRFILSDRFDFHVIDNQSIAVNAFASRILMPFSAGEILLSRYVNLSTNFREPLFRVEMSPYSHSNHMSKPHIVYNVIFLKLFFLEFRSPNLGLRITDDKGSPGGVNGLCDIVIIFYATS